MPTLTKILTLEQLALALSISLRGLKYWAFPKHPPNLYTKFSIPKRNSGTRVITAPAPSLRLVQRRLLQLLYEMYSPRSGVHGFVKKRSIVTNADAHADQRFVLNVDLKDFFPSINFGRVRGALIAKPMNVAPNIATVVARLACYENQLAQGAPTSPILANIVCMRLDGELRRLAKSLGCRYTRYADDLTFSTHRREFPPGLATALNPPYGTTAVVGTQLEAVLRKNGYTANQSKVRLYGRQTSQRVTGLVVNELPNVDRRYIREIRGMLHAWRAHGLADAETRFHSHYAKRHRSPRRGPPSFRNSLVGKLRFLAMVRGPANPCYVRFARECRALDPSLFPHALDGEEMVDRSVWVLECDDSGNQGTGFFVDGVGLVTCRHVLGPKTNAFHPSDPSKKYPVTVKKDDAHLDLAILDVDISDHAALKMSERDEVHRHQKLMLAGYPNFGYGDQMYRVWGTMTMVKVRSAVSYIVPNFTIASGNSGGPLLDEHYRVVGVAARGVKNLMSASADVDVFAAVSVKHLRALAET